MGKKTEGWYEPMGMTLNQKIDDLIMTLLCGEDSPKDFDPKKLWSYFMETVVQPAIEKLWAYTLLNMVYHRQQTGEIAMTRKELTELVDGLYPNHDEEFRKSEVERLLKGKTVDGEKIEDAK